MAQVIVRNIDDAVVERLRSRASSQGRSLEAELRIILSDAAKRQTPTWEAGLERVRALVGDRRFSDSTELIREDRAR